MKTDRELLEAQGAIFPGPPTIPQKRIVIDLVGISPAEIEDINISFRDGKNYITQSTTETKEDGTRVYTSVTSPEKGGKP